MPWQQDGDCGETGNPSAQHQQLEGFFIAIGDAVCILCHVDVWRGSGRQYATWRNQRPMGDCVNRPGDRVSLVVGQLVFSPKLPKQKGIFQRVLSGDSGDDYGRLPVGESTLWDGDHTFVASGLVRSCTEYGSLCLVQSLVQPIRIAVGKGVTPWGKRSGYCG